MPNILEISIALVFRTRLIVLDLGARQGYIFHLEISISIQMQDAVGE